MVVILGIIYAESEKTSEETSSENISRKYNAWL